MTRTIPIRALVGLACAAAMACSTDNQAALVPNLTDFAGGGSRAPGVTDAGGPSAFDPGITSTPFDSGGFTPAPTGQDTRTNNLGDTQAGQLSRVQRACGLAMEASAGIKPIGAPCNDHSECTTGYCYDEWLMNWQGGLRFCTISCLDCAGVGQQHACNEFDQGSEGSGAEYTCVHVSNSITRQCFGDSELRALCLPTCNGQVQRCSDWFGPGVYDECGFIDMSASTCPDAGFIGALDVCYKKP